MIRVDITRWGYERILQEDDMGGYYKRLIWDDIIRGSVFTEHGKHHFIFSKFYHGFLQKRKWDEKSQLTQQMLKEHFDCKEERPTISKKKITIMTVKSFEKLPDNYKPKQFKPKDPF